jgi:isopropylmalate/homocitrate/citramalate synthase
MWLYRGAWFEFETYEIEMAVPLSPQEVLRKRNAIFKHQSQKDSRFSLAMMHANFGCAPKIAMQILPVATTNLA